MARFLRNLFSLLPKRDFASAGNGRLATRLLALDAVDIANIIGSNDYNSDADSLPSRKDASSDVGDSQKCCPGCLRCPRHLGRDSIAMAASAAYPAVVNISGTAGFNGMTSGIRLGSGTIIDPDGTILTCALVVKSYQSRLYFPTGGKVDVTLQDGRTFKGTVNANLRSDIAFVKIKSKTPLPVAKFGSSGKLRPGDWVVALGGPLSLQNTVTIGIVCRHSNSCLGGMLREYLQTDCAINDDNLGGPLVNLDGEVVGVNFMTFIGPHDLNFVVAIDAVAKIVERFRKNGHKTAD